MLIPNDQTPINKDYWNSIVASGHGHIFQTFHWSDVLQAFGIEAIPFMFEDKAVLMAYKVPVARISSLGYRCDTLQVLRGPVFKHDRFDTVAFEEVLSRLVQYAHDHRIVALDLFPNLPASDSKSRDWLVTHGFRPVYNRLAFHTQTYILNCARSDEELLSCMEKRTRWSLRRAQRMGVSVRHGTDEQLLDLFFMVYSIANPSPQSKMFFENVNRILGTRGLARFFVSEVKGDCAAAMFALMFGPTIFYIWGGTNPDYRSQHAGTLLHWEAIRWGRSNGFTLYDFHGALVEDIDKFGADEKTSNVALFKRGFGGSLLKYMPQHRAVFSSFKYTMANAIRRAASVVH